MPTRKNFVAGKEYSDDALKLIGSIALTAPYYGFRLVTDGLLRRAAMEQLEKNLDLHPGDRINDPETISGFAKKYFLGGTGIQEVPRELLDVFKAFQKY